MPDAHRTTVRRVRLGRELRRLREARGWTLESAAIHLDRAYSSVGKIERGEQGITQGDLVYMLDQYGLKDEKLRAALITLRRDSRKRGWWLDYQGRIEHTLLDYISLEDDATAIRTFEALILPGLLQTENYARAAIGCGVPAPSQERLAELVTLRIMRQQIITKPGRPLVWAVIDEAALRRPFGGHKIMRDQLNHLLELSSIDSLALQVLPSAVGAHPATAGAFTVMDVGEHGALPIVLVESITHSWYLEEHKDIERYRLIFQHLCASALSAADSQRLIQRVMSDL